MSTFHRKYLDNILEVWHIPSPYHYKSSSIIIPIVVNPLLYILCLLLIICHLYHYELDKGVDIGYCHNHHGAGLPFPFMGWLFEKYCNCKQCTCYLSCFMRHWQPTLSKLGLFQLYRYIQIHTGKWRCVRQQMYSHLVACLSKWLRGKICFGKNLWGEKPRLQRHHQRQQQHKYFHFRHCAMITFREAQILAQRTF